MNLTFYPINSVQICGYSVSAWLSLENVRDLYADKSQKFIPLLRILAQASLNVQVFFQSCFVCGYYGDSYVSLPSKTAEMDLIF